MAEKYTNFVSPRGTAKYPKTDQPYSFSNKLNKSVPDADGQYELTTIMDAETAAPFVKLIQQAIKESGIEPTNLPFKKVMDKDTKKPTGEVEFKFKAYGKDKNGKAARLKFFDAKAKPMPSNFPLTSGSIVKVGGWVSVAKLGARLNIREIQVIKYVEQASSFTAEEDEDAFAYEGGNEETSFAEDNSEAGADSNNFDF